MAIALEASARYLPSLQEARFLAPYEDLRDDFLAVYKRHEVFVGWPQDSVPRDSHLARDGTELIVGIGLGDEGKGRITDNKIRAILSLPGITAAYVDRYNGGSGSGHTVKKGDITLALSQVPSGIFYPEVIGIMDSGMVIHPEDLRTEIEFIEQVPEIGDTRGKLILSEGAILATDLERAEEYLNNIKQGKSGGGTKRGMAPSYAHYLDRLGLQVFELLDNNWRETLANKYDRYVKEFEVYGITLENVTVPDYKESRLQKKQIFRKVGSKEEFLDRLESVRTWLIERKMVQNTYLIHHENMRDLSKAFVFEAAQAVGLHPRHGTYPDVAQSDTTGYGIQTGTGIWKVEQVKGRVGVIKLSYTSSVGARQMPTGIPLAREILSESDLGPAATDEQRRAAYIRKTAHEYGTISQRPRDILNLDLAMITYNARMGGIESIAGTHLDLARKGESIKVCTHYTDSQGNYIPYQPGLKYQKGVIPNYIELPGWNGETVKKARTFDEFPENAKKFLAFLQRRTGYPIVIVTTGPERENYLQIPNALPPKGAIFSVN